MRLIINNDRSFYIFGFYCIILLRSGNLKKVIEEYNKLFWNFTKQYDIDNKNLLRKLIHTYQVADVCFSIATRFNLSEEDRNFCYLLGLLHDLGRFEQWKIYGTFNDVKSVDHGDLSANIIKNIPAEDMFISEDKKNVLIDAIRYHTKKYNGNNQEVVFYNSIINNADSYSNVTTCANGTKQIDIERDGYTKEIYDAFVKEELMRVYSPCTKLDRCLILTACIYYVKFDFLRKEIMDKNYINIVYETLSKCLNEEDKKIYKGLIDNLLINYIN